MAIARFDLVCPTCGKTFEVRKQKNNRTECERFEAWAKDNPWDCPECYKADMEAQREREAERLEAKYQLPAVEGVSAKQIAYARDLRREHFRDREEKMDMIIEQLSAATEEQSARSKASNGTSFCRWR